MYYIIYTKYFDWTLDEKWTKVHLKSIGMDVFNPLFITDEYHQHGFIGNFYEYDNKTLLTSTGLIFKSSNDTTPTNEELSKVGELIVEFLLKLRYVSKQINITKDSFVLGISYQKQIIITTTKKPSRINLIPISLSYVLTGIDNKKFKDADKVLSQNLEEKSYNEITLDAFESYIGKDFRKSILFSAIASEILLRHQYVDNYAIILKKKFLSKQYRALKDPSKNLKEPIIEYLLEASKNKFDLLLHELPLYIFHYTFRYNKTKLYEDLKTLHYTRNFIVHHGKILTEENPKKKLLSLNLDGAKKALTTLKLLYNNFNDDYANDILIDDNFK